MVSASSVRNLLLPSIKPESIDQSCAKIRRISRGVYDVPKNIPRSVRSRRTPMPWPGLLRISRVIACKPARAANALGLSSQVPVQIVYLIDGSSRKIKVGNQIIQFKDAGRGGLAGSGHS
jgi:hypothetical protein